MPIRLLIVDDNAHFLEAARRLLERQGMTVVGVASTTLDALRRAEELRPDVTLVDIELGHESGFDLARRLAEGTEAHRPPVILISAYPEQDLADLIDASPAVGFLAKSGLSGGAIFELVGRTDKG
ncbi:MAG: putative transcriptional regulator [Actinobacteria bacterium]|nr:putative transcriptional regulator [Actinomycetota bacterium]MCW3044758.1 putative transcriptional regulator [Actinomycetota bacterium]